MYPAAVEPLVLHAGEDMQPRRTEEDTQLPRHTVEAGVAERGDAIGFEKFSRQSQ